MPETVFGLPLHVLVVHAAVVLVPVSGLLAIVIAVSQDRRLRWGMLTWLLATTALVAVVIARFSGEQLRDSLFPDVEPPKVTQHGDYGSSSIWFTAAMWLAITAMLLLDIDRRRRSGFGSPLLPSVVAVVAILAAMVASGQIVLTAWSGVESHWSTVGDGTPNA
jgi:hypothetical protein